MSVLALIWFFKWALGWYMLWQSLLPFVLDHEPTSSGDISISRITKQILSLMGHGRDPPRSGLTEMVPLGDYIRVGTDLLKRLQVEGLNKTTMPSSEPQLHTSLVVFASIVGTLGVLGLHRLLVWRCRSAADIPSAWFKQRRRLHCLVLAVNDSDNLRCMHLSAFHRIWKGLTLGFFKPSTPSGTSGTINVRLAGIDAPELGHFGQGPAQPLAKEAQGWLSRHSMGRRVVVELQRLDQYGRVVGVVYGPRRRWFGLGPLQCLNVDMLSAGLACVYRQGGREYGRHQAEMERAERDAQARSRGMWALKKLVLPSEFKKRL